MKIVEYRKKSQFCYLEKGVLKLHWAAMIKPRKIEHSGFLAATAAQEAHLSVRTSFRTSVRPHVRNQVVFLQLFAPFGNCWHLFATVGNCWQHLATFVNFW